MISIRKDQRGTGVLEIILIIVIIAIIAGVGWYVYHTAHNSNKTFDQATSTSQNAGPHFAKPKNTKATPKPSSELPAQLPAPTTTKSDTKSN